MSSLFITNCHLTHTILIFTRRKCRLQDKLDWRLRRVRLHSIRQPSPVRPKYPTSYKFITASGLVWSDLVWSFASRHDQSVLAPGLPWLYILSPAPSRLAGLIYWTASTPSLRHPCLPLPVHLDGSAAFANMPSEGTTHCYA